MTHYIYCITNVINNKKYIGQSINVAWRFKQHIYFAANSDRYKSKNFAIHHAINKYGIDNFTLEVLHECLDLDDSNLKEEYFIKILNTLAPNGYNLTPGGNNTEKLESTREKIRESLKRKSYFIGKKGADHPNFGRKLSDERKKQLSNQFSGDNGSGKKINSVIAREIYLCSLNNEKSTLELCEMHGIKKGAILNILNKRSWVDVTKDLPNIDVKSHARGEYLKCSKITEEICANILRDYFYNGKSVLEIMSHYNLSYSIVYGVVSRKKWKHVSF